MKHHSKEVVEHCSIDRIKVVWPSHLRFFSFRRQNRFILKKQSYLITSCYPRKLEGSSSRIMAMDVDSRSDHTVRMYQRYVKLIMQRFAASKICLLRSTTVSCKLALIFEWFKTIKTIGILGIVNKA